MAGGGVKGGTTYGATDEFGARAAENKVHIHDLHATILALLGFDHTKLTYRYNGRDFRLTEIAGRSASKVSSLDPFLADCSQHAFETQIDFRALTRLWTRAIDCLLRPDRFVVSATRAAELTTRAIGFF